MDERFSHMGSDPRFRAMPKKQQKVKIDKRFKSMFHDKKFKLKYNMDKRGKPLQSSTSEDLKRYYEISSNSESERSSDDDDDNDDEEGGSEPDHIKAKQDSSDAEANSLNDDLNNSSIRSKKKVHFSEDAKLQKSDDDSSNDNDDSEDEKDKNQVDLARGIGNVETSSSEDEDDSDEESEDDEEITHEWGELDKEAPKSENITNRLAICNMDWDRIKASDLFVLANSFKPADGVIKCIKIYPSEFGLERMKEEEVRGPAELVQETLKSDDEDYTQTNEGSKYHMEKLRKYQLNRLKYYYAIMECDTPETASKLYEELDGMEYESSASQLDLRFVPDDVTFEHEPTSVCETLPDLSTYEPVLFTTTALQQASVQLTWDETNPDRVRTIQKAFSAADEVESDLKTYLASSSEDEGISSEEGINIEEKPTTSSASRNFEVKTSNKQKPEKKGGGSTIEKYKALLADLEEQEKKEKDRDVTLEISWEPGLKGKAESLLKKREKMKDATPFEEFLEKKKEKKKLRKEQKTPPSLDNNNESEDEDEGGQAFSDDDIPDDVDLNDPFFKEELDNSNIKKTKSKKQKKNRFKGEEETEENEKSQAELELLMMDEDDRIDQNKHFNLKNLMDDKSKSKIKREKKKMKKMKKVPKEPPKDEEEFQVDVADPRFTALYESALFNIDPSDPHYKKTKAMQTFVEEKFKRRAENNETFGAKPNKLSKLDKESDEQQQPKINPSLSLLVNSVKNKVKNYGNKKS